MSSVDVDALDAARAAATASYLKLTAEYWRDGDWTTWDWHEHADDLLALLNMRRLLAEVRRGRALREAVDGLAEDWDRTAAIFPEYGDLSAAAARSLRAVLAATDGIP